MAAQIDPVDDPDLAAQFDAWLEHRPRDLPQQVREVEVLLSTALPMHTGSDGEAILCGWRRSMT